MAIASWPLNQHFWIFSNIFQPLLSPLSPLLPLLPLLLLLLFGWCSCSCCD